jgi:ribose transport system permease protein
MSPDLGLRRLRLNLAQIVRIYGTLIALLALGAFFALFIPNFATTGNLLNISLQISFLVIMATGATIIMAVAEYDLSVGAMASLGGVLTAELAIAGLPMWLAFALSPICGAAFGAAVGWIVTQFRVLSFITTLAAGTVLAGLTLQISGGATVFDNIPADFTDFGQATWGSVPVPAVVMFALLVLAWLVLAQTPFGRRVYAVGGNQTAARIAGIRVQLVKMVAFAACAALAAFTGALLASRLGSASPTGGSGLFLQSYAAVFLGMTVFQEGVPNVWGTFVGAVLIGTLENGLTMLEVATPLQDILTGLIIVAAIVVQRIGQRD